jgi:tetratricopeptide (TPR) repeat protein
VSRHQRHLVALALLVAAAAGPLNAAKAPADPGPVLAAAQAKIDQDDPAGAVALLAPLLKRDPKLAQGYLLRGTARLMQGEAGGKEDLDRALGLDPTLRQAWLHRAALAVAEKRYDAALADFQKARELDPGDADGILNIGAVQLLLGQLDEASRSFQEFLGQRPRDAGAHYLVAKNYALAGYAGLALQSVQQAIALDERVRSVVSTDANFADLAGNPRFQELMSVDSFRPAAGVPHVERNYPGAYAAGRGPLLPATMDALRGMGEPFDARVEVTPDWALLWGALRIKLSDSASGEGIVSLSPRQEGMSDADWRQKSQQLLDAIFIHLAKRRASAGPRPTPTP